MTTGGGRIAKRALRVEVLYSEDEEPHLTLEGGRREREAQTKTTTTETGSTNPLVNMVEGENRARIEKAKGGGGQGKPPSEGEGEGEGRSDMGEGGGLITKLSGNDGGEEGGTTTTTGEGGGPHDRSGREEGEKGRERGGGDGGKEEEREERGEGEGTSPRRTETARAAAPTAVSGTHGYGHTKMAPIPGDKPGVATRGGKKRKSNEQGGELSPGEKDGPGKAGATGTLATVPKKTQNLRSDKEYVPPQKKGTGEAEMAEGTTMSQFDPIVEEEQEEDDARIARNTVEGTGLNPPNVALPDDVEGGVPWDRPTRLLNTERADKAKGKGGPEKPKEPEK